MTLPFGTGYIPSPPDHRDYRLVARLSHPVQLPESFTIETMETGVPIRNQEQAGKCTSFASTNIQECNDLKETGSLVNLSQQKLYTEAKRRDGYNGVGTYPRVILQVLQDVGTIRLEEWPYVGVDEPIGELLRRTTTGPELEEAKDHRISAYARVSSPVDLMVALMDHGPVMIGVDLYPAFETLNSEGRVPLPHPGEGSIGGHAMCLYGWRPGLNGVREYKCRNQWSETLANAGNCFFPENYPGLFEDMWLVVDAVTPRTMVIKPATNEIVTEGPVGPDYSEDE